MFSGLHVGHGNLAAKVDSLVALVHAQSAMISNLQTQLAEGGRVPPLPTPQRKKSKKRPAASTPDASTPDASTPTTSTPTVSPPIRRLLRPHHLARNRRCRLRLRRRLRRRRRCCRPLSRHLQCFRHPCSLTDGSLGAVWRLLVTKDEA